MNEQLDELVYSMEDLSLSELKVFMNKGDTGGPQGKFEASTSMKDEWQEFFKSRFDRKLLGTFQSMSLFKICE